VLTGPSRAIPHRADRETEPPVIKTTLDFLRDRIGLKRILLVVAVAMLATAGYVLFTKLRLIDWAKVWEAIGQIGAPTLLLAGLFTAAAYATLTVYDYFATRTIGREDIPYPACAIGSFSSYSIAHNLGATVFTAAVVRYLVYSRYKITGPQVVKICFIAGLTFWLGNATVLGLGFVLEPWVVTPVVAPLGISGDMVRIVGVIILAVLAGWLFFVSRPRQFGSGTWQIKLPTARLTFLQMVIGIVDLACTAMILYVLLMAMPNAPPAPFVAVAVIFCSAMLLGFATHAPGAAGAFEATLLVALPPLGFTAEAVVAAFILFRLYYFIGPFVLALIVVAIREFAGGRGSLDHLKESMAVIREAEASQEAAKAAAKPGPQA
jgi:glycosyltransferase 2 family protein